MRFWRGHGAQGCVAARSSDGDDRSCEGAILSCADGCPALATEAALGRVRRAARGARRRRLRCFAPRRFVRCRSERRRRGRGCPRGRRCHGRLERALLEGDRRQAGTVAVVFVGTGAACEIQIRSRRTSGAGPHRVGHLVSSGRRLGDASGVARGRARRGPGDDEALPLQQAPAIQTIPDVLRVASAAARAVHLPRGARAGHRVNPTPTSSSHFEGAPPDGDRAPTAARCRPPVHTLPSAIAMSPALRPPRYGAPLPPTPFHRAVPRADSWRRFAGGVQSRVRPPG